MIGGTWMPELVELAGGEALVTRPGDHAPTLDIAALAKLDPEVVLIKPCGFDLARTLLELELLGTELPWKSWEAVRKGRVYAADGNAFFNRPGPRLVESLEILAACTHPAAFPDLARRHAASVLRVTPELELVPLA
jgi:iron complex transport system substrate-binding protein